MKRRILLTAAWFVLVLFVSNVDSIGQTPSPTPTPPIDVMYTGKLLGYFRNPSLQKMGDKGCPDNFDDASYAAKLFLPQRQGQNSSILVGTGDNFAPELEARVFADPKEPADKYHVGNKELYFGKADGWVFYKTDDQALEKQLREGHGVIPSDNVACFLRAAKFAAIVPGKHDFYFGAERVRQFARFLASKAAGDYEKPVQMLGANLVLKTVPIGGASSEAVKQHGIGAWPEGYSVLNLKEGKTVYPWLPAVKIKVDKVADPNGAKVSLCTSPGGPNEIDLKKCLPIGTLKPADVGNTIILKLPHLPKPHDTNVKDGHFSTLIPGKNYGLCVEQNSTNGCLRFSSHIPFFYFPHVAPKENEDGYIDPDPFVVKNDRVAIFGVVDPDLGEQVGILNFGWKNKQSGLTTRVSVEDPAEALEQQLEYFKELKPTFTGLKILLAQMTPQRARALASRFPEFQIVVSGADQALSTSEVEMSTAWDGRKRAFMAVPAPYFDAGKGTVYFGTIKATEVSDKWRLESASYRDPIEIKPPAADFATEFWARVKELPGCLPKFEKDPKDNPENAEYLKWIVLCAMRDHTNADVALIQHRDLFDQIPDFLQSNERLLERAKTGQSPSELNERIQQTLDSLIWKGDLVTLLYVPGGDLKKALKQSDKYAAEEKSPLALSIDKGRQLEKLGIKEEDGEYFINDLPLDEKKIYAVATTDYIGAGDTGYPDLVKAALNPRTHPAAFSLDLIPVSSLVCRKLFPKSDDAERYCLGPVESHKYLDQTIAERIPPYKQPDFFKKVRKFFESGWPDGSTEAKTTEEAIEQTVRRREIWRYSLENFSIGFKALGKNLSDKEVGEKFEGIPVSGVTATESESWNVGINTRLTRSSHKREFFASTGLEFERQENGDTPSAFQISEAKNRLFGETGLVIWRTPGRSLPNFGMNFSVYAETQVTRPFSDFTLASGDKFRISQNRSLLLLPRFGFRWQGKANAAEVGVQAGREIDALSGYRFATAAGDVECLAIDTPSFSKCIKEKSDPEKGGTITINSERSVVLNDRPRAGMYWKLNLSLPFTSKVKYELAETGDFFFVNFHQDTTLDTSLRVISKHRLSFEIWPSVSIGPALDLLLYKNKRNRDFLFQRQFGIETKISFDIFNRREKGVQFKHKP